MSQTLNAEFVFERIPPRAPESHKGSYGRLLIVAGSSRYRGAAALATEGALRTGAGIVTLATVEPVLQGILPRLPECCCLPCTADEVGGISAENLPALLAALKGCTALLIGPGLGMTENTKQLVRTLVTEAACPVVLDADGLNAAAALLNEQDPDRDDPQPPALPRPQNGAALVLTPHPGEMGRLAGLSAEEINANREGTAAGYARANGCVLVLKGHRTLVAAPDGRIYKNKSGNPGLARGGSGDVLAGMLAGLLAQKLDAVDAAACAVWLHGTAADGAAARMGQYGMLPHDIFYDLERLFAQNGR